MIEIKLNMDLYPIYFKDGIIIYEIRLNMKITLGRSGAKLVTSKYCKF